MISQEDRRENLVLVTVSDIGSNHKLFSIPNQDAVAFNCVDEDFVLAVSDGVGSCKNAEQGSEYTTNACLKLFREIKSHDLPFENEALAKGLIFTWRCLIEDNQFDNFCATVKAVFKIGNQVKMISLGDGISAISSDGIHLISPSEKTCFSNETRCLCSRVTPRDFWIADFQLDTYKPYVVFCCTDGVANSIVQGEELNLIKDIEKNSSLDELKSELEELLSEIGQYCFDDKTVGVVKYERKH